MPTSEPSGSPRPVPDFGRRSADYATHRPGFPDSFYERLGRYLALDGAEAVDLGTGPGVVALALARRGAAVTGIDVAENQIAAARDAAARAGLAGRCAFRVGRAESTRLPAASVDLVTAGQCWTWFDHDAALAEVLRILRPGGHLAVAHFCYLPGRSAVAARTEDLILRYNPGWDMAGRDGTYAAHIDGFQAGGLELVEQFCYDHDQPFTHESWRGRMRTCNGVGSGVLSDERVAAFDHDLAALLRAEFPAEPLIVRHRVWATVLRKAEAAP